MIDTKLAIKGGSPEINQRELRPYTSITDLEKKAVERVISSGSLSGFYGSYGAEFLGGNEVRKFEAEWSRKFSVPYAVSVNSNTSGLIAAMGAVGISPGDEVIVPPTTMSATAIAPLFYGGIPVFADIEPETFCLDIESVKNKINLKTKAVIAVNLFGHPARLRELSELCLHHGIFLIEDNAQAPLASENGVHTGTIGDIGVFSLNYHKHIHTGEGGVCVTSNPDFAKRLQAIRNHAENIVEPAGLSPVNMIGFNFRMTELAAAIGRTQLQRIDEEVRKRQRVAQSLSMGVTGLAGLRPPEVRQGCEHVYYIWALSIDETKLGVTREVFSKALEAEGFPHFLGYVQPLYYLPLFQKKIAIGDQGWPFSLTKKTYCKGLCPVAEDLYDKKLLCFETCAFELNDELIQKLINAILKVHRNINLL